MIPACPGWHVGGLEPGFQFEASGGDLSCSQTLASRTTVLSLCLSFAASPAALAQHEGHDHASTQATSQSEFSGDPYLCDTDVVTGTKLGSLEKQVVNAHEGREVRFNSEKPVHSFRSTPAKCLAEVDAALVRQQLPFYPLETCPCPARSSARLASRGTSCTETAWFASAARAASRIPSRIRAGPRSFVTWDELSKKPAACSVG